MSKNLEPTNIKLLEAMLFEEAILTWLILSLSDFLQVFNIKFKKRLIIIKKILFLELSLFEIEIEIKNLFIV